MLLLPILVPIKISLSCQPFQSRFTYNRHSLDFSKPSKNYRYVSHFGILRILERRHPGVSQKSLYMDVCYSSCSKAGQTEYIDLKQIEIVRTIDKHYLSLHMVCLSLLRACMQYLMYNKQHRKSERKPLGQIHMEMVNQLHGEQ